MWFVFLLAQVRLNTFFRGAICICLFTLCKVLVLFLPWSLRNPLDISVVEFINLFTSTFWTFWVLITKAFLTLEIMHEFSTSLSPQDSYDYSGSFSSFFLLWHLWSIWILSWHKVWVVDPTILLFSKFRSCASSNFSLVLKCY